MDEDKYKSLLIVNDSEDVQITLYLYLRWDIICWMSFKSKIIRPKEKYLYRSEEGFQFKLVARFEDERPKKTLLELQRWNEDKLFKITGHSGADSPILTGGKLSHYPVEKRICLRKLQRDKELKTTCGERNLYDILGLDMSRVRKMSKEEQTEAIKKGFRTQIRIWHPDHNGGDEEIAKEILFAFEILRDEEKRARYHNLADYDKGWLSWGRYRAIFWPECVTKEQKWAYRKRMMLFALSALMTVGGIGLTIFSAGLAAPAWVAAGAVFGSGFAGAGLQSLQHTLNKESVVDECRAKDWLKKAGFGFVGGAATGGVAAGVTGVVAGLGSAAVESAALTAGQYVGVGAATGAAGGVASSLASDAGRCFVDGENVTWKQAIGRAACGAAVGAVAGVAGGAVTKAIVGTQTTAATATLKGEIGEQLVILTGARRLGNTLARNIPRMLTENGTEAVMGGVAQFAEERLDDSLENQSPGEHVVDGLKNVATSTVKGLAIECSSALASHVKNEIEVHRRLKKDYKPQLIDDEAEMSRIKQIRRRQIRHGLFKENNEHLHSWKKGKCSATYKPLTTKNPTRRETNNLDLIYEEDDEREEQEADEKLQQEGKIKYISEGAWISKMTVKYSLNGKKDIQEVCGSGKFIDIPSNAREIEVRFQVKRPVWGDISKYDRFQKCWCEPDQAHVFCYDTPPIRTFTISGSLWFEAVMRVSDQYHEETYEM